MTTPGSSRGRPRDEQSDVRILAAAREILAAGGVDAMSFEAIAQRAGVTRPSIYRRWPDKAHLLNEIANGPSGQADPLAWSIDEAIRNLATRVLDHYGKAEVRAANVGLIVAYQHSPELRAVLQSPIETTARRDFAESFARARMAGHVPESATCDVVFDMVVGAVVFRTIFSALPPGPDMAEQICAIIMAGLGG